ncbi:GNAT family N-acetyltransferase [Devosia sp. XK-2]|uniref:GNAT family N-acetyltransferase n=1 Tax=Devosia sp. XK-2 TaxID=3126689 RepID=UPI0030CC8E8F
MTGPLILSTNRPGLLLRRLTPDDAFAVYELVQKNRSHLTAHGDFAELVVAQTDALSEEFALSPERHWRFGVLLEDVLIGRADLVGVQPAKYSIGYWLSEAVIGRGLATFAVGRLLRFAFDEMRATDVFAGVSHGNERSAALLLRLGFKSVERFETYTRFHRQAG